MSATSEYGPCVSKLPEDQRYVVSLLLRAMGLPETLDLGAIMMTVAAHAEEGLLAAETDHEAGRKARAEERRDRVRIMLGAMADFAAHVMEPGCDCASASAPKVRP
jgi:hypothetical protein